MASNSLGRASGDVRVWDLPLRLFHWLLVVMVAVAFLSSEEGSPLSEWHVASGWAAAVLVVFRLVWGFAGGEHSRFSSFVKPAALGGHLRELLRGRAAPSLGHNPLGAVSAILLLGLIGATVWTGATVAEESESLHEGIAYLLLALVAVHVLAVVLMSVLSRENLVAAMFTGRKRAARHPGARDARDPGLAPLVVAAAALAGAVLLIASYDEQAFQARSLESFEHRAAGAGPAGAGEREGPVEAEGYEEEAETD